MGLIRIFSPENFIKIPYQFIFFIITTILASSIFYTAFYRFLVTDPAPKIQILTPITAEKIGITSKSITVETGIHIENFQEFDLTKNNFVITALVWFKFDHTVTSLDTIGQFSFDKGDILSISKPETKLIEKLLFAEYRVKLKFTSNLNYSFFPIDDHRIYITLANKAVSPHEIILTSSESNFSISPNIMIQGWKKIRHSVTTGYTEALLDKNDPKTAIYHPAVIFSLDFASSGLRKLTVILLPLFFVLFVAFLTLSLNAVTFGRDRITMTIASITGLIGYRFVIENISPAVSYFLLSDHLFNLFFGLIFLVLLFNLIVIGKELPKLTGITLILLHSLFLAVWYYLFLYWATV